MTGPAENILPQGYAGARWALFWVLASTPAVVLLLQSPGGGWAAMLGYHIGCLCAAKAAGVEWGRRPAPWELMACAGTTLVLLGVASQVLPVIQVVVVRATPSLQLWGMQGWSGTLAFSWYVLINPWIEEAFWRGALLGSRFQRHVGRRRAEWIATLGFVPYHSAVIYLMFGADAWWFSLPVLLGSASWVLMTRWRRSVIPAAVSHQMADLMVILLYVLRRTS